MTPQAWLAGLASFIIVIGAFFGLRAHQPLLAPTQLATTTPEPASETTPTNQVSNTTTNMTTTAAAAALPTGSAWLAVLPLGDGDYSTSAPKQGFVYLCHIASGGGGAQGSPPWISSNQWYPAQKVAVEGAVAWPNAAYSMSVSGATRVITSNGEPTDHDTGIFPIAQSDPAHQFDGNPNHIATQNYSFSLPAYPSQAASAGCIFGQVGIMNDGVPLFDAFDAEYRDAVAHETQDVWEGHPDASGAYHYHGFEAGAVKDSVSQVVGFAFDGFPITGSQLPSGKYLHTADLDECHGLTSTITLDGKSVTTYHYVLTQDFPYSISCFHGTSHEPKPAGGVQQQGSGQMPPPPPR